MLGSASLPNNRAKTALHVDLDRLQGLARRAAGAHERVRQLIGLARRGLAGMYAGDGVFVPVVRGREAGRRRAGPASDTIRATAIVALGLSRLGEDTQRRVLKGETAAGLAGALGERAIGCSDVGAMALAAWAMAEAGGRRADALVAELARRLAPDRPVGTLPCAWALTAALAARRYGDTAELIAVAAARLLAGQARSGLFAHLLPADARGWTRAHVGSFADQAFAIQALARLAAALDDARALEAAGGCAARVVASQGVAGQWWWEYDTQDGGVVEGYPVYSAHQYALAPMALLELREAGGKDRWWPVIRGLGWLDRHPETGEPLYSDDALLWRRVGRNDPAGLVRQLAALTTGLKAGWHLPGLDAVFPPGRVDHECRPFELGWLLYAWHSGGTVMALQQGGGGDG